MVSVKKRIVCSVSGGDTRLSPVTVSRTMKGAEGYLINKHQIQGL